MAVKSGLVYAGSDEMNHSTCIRHPEKNRYIQLYDWQVSFCQNNHCAALLLAYFIAWHDWKLRNDQYYRRANDIAEMHNDGRTHNENAYLFFSTEQLVDGCMGLYGKKAVVEGLDLLAALGVISIHKNPNPRYHFDKTKYFQFYPQLCNRWIAENYAVDASHDDASDTVKMADRKGENVLPSYENNRPAGESSQAITDTTNNTSNKKQSINARDKDCSNHSELDCHTAQTVIDALIEKGMPANRFYTDSIDSINKLIAAGATSTLFLEGYQISIFTTKSNGFGINYLVKVVETLLIKGKKEVVTTSLTNNKEPVYEDDLNKAQSWAGDLI